MHDTFRTCRVCLVEQSITEYYPKSRYVCKTCYINRVLQNKKSKRAMYTAIDSKRRLTKRGATPAMTPQEKKDIYDVYDLAAQLRLIGFDVAVDHVDPIMNKRVCGLHNLANLRIIPKKENLSKSNKFEPYGVDALGHIYSL